MRVGKVGVGLVIVLAMVAATASAQPARGRSVAGQLIVTFAPGTSVNAQADAHRAARGRVLNEIAGRGVALVSVPDGDEVAAAARYRRHPAVRSAAPNYLRSVPEPTAHDAGSALVPRDTYFGQQWGFHNTGQEFYCFAWIDGDLCFFQGASDADIDAPEAWAITTGSPAVAVAVIDTGIDYTHPDLASHYAGGYDFVHSTFDPRDDHGHGTHVAGTIAASLDNLTGSPAAAEGVVGVAPQARLLAYKVCAADGTCTDFAVIQAIARAVADGAKVINMSLGDAVYSQPLDDAVQAAWNAGVVIVAGAGNDGTAAPFYPAALDHVVAVGAFDEDHRRASFSNYGSWVDISAPGSNILSTYPLSQCTEAGVPGDTGCYAWLSGTSMATPHVSGAAALLWSRGDVTSNAQVVDLLMRGADPSGVSNVRLDSWTIHGGLNLHDSLSDGLATGKPVANAGPDQTVRDADNDGTELVSLDGSASQDPDGSLVAYEWREGAAVVGASAQLTVALAVGTHTLTLEVTDNDGLTATDTVVVTVESPAVVTIAASSTEAREAGLQAGVFTVTRAGDTSGPLTVAYVVSGAAAAGVDYQALSGSVPFPAGAATATITVVPIDDDLLEVDEPVVVTLSAGTGYGVGAPASASLVIVSDDLPPDLIVQSAIAPVTAGADADIAVTDTTKNQGTGAAAASAVWFYLSKNGSLDASDVFLGTRPVPRLEAGASNAGTTSVRIPASTVTGTYYVLVKSDGTDQVPEGNETNNVRASGTIKIGPDLVVSALSLPASAAPGATISVSDTTRNQGGGRGGPTSTRFYLSTNSSLDTSDVLLGSRDVPELAAGASHSGVTPVTVPPNTAGGAYYVIAQADAGKVLTETYETNNSRSVWSLKVGADLVVSALTVPTVVGVGSTIDVNDSTGNQGAGPADASATAFYLSGNAVFDASDVFLGARTVGALAAGASSTVVTPVQIPSGTAPGAYYVLAKADWSGAIPEGDEGNNTRAANVRIGSDLAVTALTASASTVMAGGAATATDTTKNQGGDPAPASSTRLYLSTNASLDSGDLLLGTRMVPALAAGASHAGSLPFTIPVTTAAGSYYIIAVADGDQAVAEALENNNTRIRSIWVSAAP